jgi:hypothetical protein
MGTTVSTISTYGYDCKADRQSDYKDLVIEITTDREADYREANRQLIDLVADLAYENYLLRTLIGRAHRHPYQRPQNDSADA